MSRFSEERLYGSARWLSIAFVTATTAVSGGALLLGWAAGMDGVARSSDEMVPTTAFAFALLGFGLLLWWRQVPRGRSPAVVLLGALTAALVLVELAALGAGVPGGVEGLLMDDWRGGAMSYATALQLLLGSYCLAALAEPRIWNPWAFPLCATSGLLLSLVAVVGHAFDADALSEVFLFGDIAPKTAIVAALLHVALLLKRPRASWVGLLLERGAGSASARRLLPFAVLGPFLLCLGTLGLVRAGIFNTNFRLTLLTIALTLVSALAILRNAAVTNRAERAASRDRLTGLANRTLFIEELGRTVAEAEETRATVGLVLVDLDRFKSINQVLGDTIGDAVLRSVSARLNRTVATTDTLARIGGDEFALVLPGRHSRAEIEAETKRLQHALTSPSTINGGQIETGATFGVAIYPDDATDARTLRRYADLAISNCKANARRGICYFSPEIEGAAMRRAQVASDLRTAIERNEFQLMYQPLFDMASRRIHCVEALLRWNHAERGIIRPAEFVPIAEESGLIRPLGHWVLKEACAQKAAWDRQGFDLKVAVNVSPAETVFDDYPEFLEAVLDDAGLDGAGIELEITEGVLIEHDRPSVSSFLAACEKRGIGIAIDDFGTGYSSLGYLKRLPVSKIKIDRSFVMELGNPDGLALVEALVAVGHRLDKRIVAEGIEAEFQLDALERLGCHDAQGYFLSPPIDADCLQQRLQATTG